VTVHNPAGVRRLVVGCWTTIHKARSLDSGVTLAEAKAYIDAAHIGLSALGCDIAPAPFGLYLLVQEAIESAGAKPAATSSYALAAWREQLTDAIVAQITPRQGD
jgi:hypothetical protein